MTIRSVRRHLWVAHISALLLAITLAVIAVWQHRQLMTLRRVVALHNRVLLHLLEDRISDTSGYVRYQTPPPGFPDRAASCPVSPPDLAPAAASVARLARK